MEIAISDISGRMYFLIWFLTPYRCESMFYLMHCDSYQRRFSVVLGFRYLSLDTANKVQTDVQ